MNIVLGIYNTFTFKDAHIEVGNCAYPFTEIIGDYWCDEAIDVVIDTVFEAALRCNKIIFCIDNLLPNITGMEDSYTCQELITILSSPVIPLSKIEFREDNNVVSYNYVVDKLNLSKELFIE